MLKTAGFTLKEVGNHRRILSPIVTSDLPFGKSLLAIPCGWSQELELEAGEMCREAELSGGIRS